jgi:hypothetical protein
MVGGTIVTFHGKIWFDIFLAINEMIGRIIIPEEMDEDFLRS